MIKAVAAAAGAAAGLPLALILLVTAAGTAPAAPAPAAATGSGAVQAAATGLDGAPTPAARTGIPADYLAWYMAAARTCPGLPWTVLAGIGTVESDNGRSSLPGVHSGSNFAGAEGPMQFLPATFAEYAVNADPGQPVSPYNPADAIYTAAAMLCASGAHDGTPAGIEQAVFAYNHADWYVSQVMSWAARYAAQGTGTASPAAAAIAFARAQLGKPYQWGGSGPDSYDCSGLVWAAYAAAGIHIARTTYQWQQDGPAVYRRQQDGPAVTLAQLQPGDLLFSAGSDGTPANPGHVVMYLGDGQVIQAPRTGTDVQTDPADLDSVVAVTRPAALTARP
jgi:cell wall-associated NlpC family hydrolase